MPIKMRIAETTQEIDSVYLLRHKVFVEQEDILKPRDEKRLYDKFDSFPSSVQMIAQWDNDTIGAFRLSLDDSCGLPADDYFDYRPHVPEGARLMHAGMFCVHRDFRGEKIALGLILMAGYYAMSHNVTHIVAPINPALAVLLRRIGFKKVAEQFHHPHIDYDVLPLMLDIRDVKDYFVDFIKQNQMHDFIMDYQRWFCKADEYIVRAGEKGNEAFIIIDGVAEVRLPGTGEVLATLEQGEMFGELAIITDENRSADVVAKTEVQMMVMTKETFLKRFVEDADKALILMRMISKRSQAMIMNLKAGRLGNNTKSINYLIAQR